MLTLISKAVSFLLKGVSSDSSPSDLTLADRAEQHGFEELPWLIKTADNINTRSSQGKVTHLFHNYGLIDGDVYFSLSAVHGGDKLQVGDSVHFKAVQQHADGAWNAEEITAISQTWERQTQQEADEIDLNVLQSQVVIGKVTLIRDGVGRIDTDIAFDIDECQEGYVPMRGDWVSANVAETVLDADQDAWQDQSAVRVRRACCVCPARTNSCEGCVTCVMSDHGYIDGEIYFTRTACLNGYNPVKNDVVKVCAIESDQGKCGWRAVSVVPLSSHSDTYRSKKFQQTSRPGRPSSGAWLVPGQRPNSFAPRVVLPVKLGHFAVPENLESSVLEGAELTDVVPQLTQDLTFSNYTRRMSTLLHLEEIQMQMDIREFDMNRVCLHPVGEFLALTVPGLAEGRPSVLIGDKIILSSPLDPDGPSYEGCVHELTSTDVLLKCSPEFHSRYRGEDYNVQFSFNRSSLRKCHQAVSLAVSYLGSAVLFPSQVELKRAQVSLESMASPVNGLPRRPVDNSKALTDRTTTPLQQSPMSQDVRYKSQSSGVPARHLPDGDDSSSHLSDGDPDLTFFNPRMNDRQRAAVRRILQGQARPIPYVIFGPPGTGKSVTVVEAILQVLHRTPCSRILVSAPSNSAADLIAERLHASGHVEQTSMVRLNAFQRSPDGIPASILQYCRFAEDMQMISRFRVIISTCSMAGNLYGLGLRPGHISHVFVDECGQATEPECLIPVGLVAGGDGQIILAGDPKQLGPIVMSPFAKMYGLELSFLERLMMRELYQRNQARFAEEGGFESLLVTMLVNNYRSHPAILELPSSLFYYNQLQAMADEQLTGKLANWQQLPKAGFPVIFHGVRGEDIRDKDSPSWFNPGEVVQVVRYLQGVLKEGVDQADIGIITPYRKQVEKIRLMIDSLHLPAVKVGSVEEFQGQERLVIIISTVRSNEKLVGFDVRHTLGFLSNPKRFNVSITRAQALLVVIGNPRVLSQDPNWRQLIQFCMDRGAYTGCSLSDMAVNNSGVHSKDGLSKDGLSKDGLSKDGLSKDGLSKDGHSKDGHSKDGHSKDGHSKDGHSKDGHSKDGHSKDGHSKDGHSKDGLSKDGHSKDGHSKDGHSKDGLFNVGI